MQLRYSGYSPDLLASVRDREDRDYDCDHDGHGLNIYEPKLARIVFK